MDRKQSRFAEELKHHLDAGRGTEAVHLFCRGAALRLFPKDDSIRQWLEAGVGQERMRQLITLFAISPCSFCRRGLEPCSECDRHGHFDHKEICESCLGLGVCRCDFCNGSGLTTIDAVPKGLRVPVAIERIGSAIQRIESMTSELPIDTAAANPVDHLKQQATHILRISGLLSVLENELGDAAGLAWWTPHPSRTVARIVADWPEIGRRAEERICAAFRSMAETAAEMAEQTAEGTELRALALARAEFFGGLASPDALDRTDVDHPVLDRILCELADSARSC